jgi:hypothetical protein
MYIGKQLHLDSYRTGFPEKDDFVIALILSGVNFQVLHLALDVESI